MVVIPFRSFVFLCLTSTVLIYVLKLWPPDPDVIGTHGLLLWSQTRYCCATRSWLKQDTTYVSSLSSLSYDIQSSQGKFTFPLHWKGYASEQHLLNPWGRQGRVWTRVWSNFLVHNLLLSIFWMPKHGHASLNLDPWCDLNTQRSDLELDSPKLQC